MPRKKFKAQRTPEYLVITSCRPENVGGIMQKFADIHLIYGAMLDYTVRYVKLIEEEHQRCGGVLDLHAPVTGNVRDLENRIRVLFSAFLASHSSLIDYLKTDIAKHGSEALQWLADARVKNVALASLERLRNMDTHHEPLHTLIGMRYRIAGPPSEIKRSLYAGETHIHWPLMHEGVGFCPWSLADTAQFAKQPGLIEYLTYSSILQLAHSAVHEVVVVLTYCASKNWFVLDYSPVCGICSDAHSASRALPNED